VRGEVSSNSPFVSSSLPLDSGSSSLQLHQPHISPFVSRSLSRTLSHRSEEGSNLYISFLSFPFEFTIPSSLSYQRNSQPKRVLKDLHGVSDRDVGVNRLDRSVVVEGVLSQLASDSGLLVSLQHHVVSLSRWGRGRKGRTPKGTWELSWL
jgi:hypothetical protein